MTQFTSENKLSIRQRVEKKRADLSPSQLEALKQRLNPSAHDPMARLSPVQKSNTGNQAASMRHSSLIEFQPDGSRPRFYCVHPAGGNVLCYMELARSLGADQPFTGLQAPGLSAQWPPRSSLIDIAAYHVEAMLGDGDGSHFLLGGWSMGGVVAFEMARQLEALGKKVGALFIIDSLAPPLSERRLTEYYRLFFASFARDLAIPAGNLELDWERLVMMEADEQSRYLLGLTQSANLIPEEIGLSKFENLLQVFTTNVRAMVTYLPRAYTGRITLLKAREQYGEDGRDHTSGWAEHAGSGVETITVPGDHFTMIREPFVKELAARIMACINEAINTRS